MSSVGDPSALEAGDAAEGTGPRPEDLRIDTALCLGEFEPGEREHRHLSDDQAICIGYANTMADTNHLPPAHWLANRIGRELFRLRLEKGAGQVGPDGKVLAQVRTDGYSWQPERVSISLHHHEGSDWLLLRRIAEEAVARACAGKRLPELALNGAGMFVAGGPNGDNGTTGKKLAMDAYGPTVPIGGGAWSGKDFNKVDRAGGMLARELALMAVKRAKREARVELRYELGGAGPVQYGYGWTGCSSNPKPWRSQLSQSRRPRQLRAGKSRRSTHRFRVDRFGFNFLRFLVRIPSRP